jgi:Ca2+-binding RTX toxin-like protein
MVTRKFLTQNNDKFIGTDAVDAIIALGGDDTIFTYGGNDTIDAGNGKDSVFAGEGKDFVDGGAGNDSIDAGIGNDTVFAGAGNDHIIGDFARVTAATGFNDFVLGQGGNDKIEGGFGADTINGGVGADKLYGGFELYPTFEGNFSLDVFVYSSISDSTIRARDTIYDFQHGSDKVQLTGLGFKGIAAAQNIGTGDKTLLSVVYDAKIDQTIVGNHATGFEIGFYGNQVESFDSTDFIF